jgi:Flp pilus assembly protein CpaB
VGNRRTLLAAAAVLLAVAAGMGVYFYVSGADRRAAEKVETVEAFVAVRDIPKGTIGRAALADGLIAPARVLRGSVPPAAVRDASTLGNKVAAATIQARQFITDASFVAPSQGGGGSLAASIGDKNLVAVTISFDAARAVANQIAPGDRVDIISMGEKNAGQYLLRGVKVLAVGTETAATAAGGNGQPSPTAAASGLITFEVTPDQALLIVSENRNGGLYLTLQPLSATGGSGGSVPASGR